MSGYEENTSRPVILNRLRCETAAEHEALEKGLDLVGPGLTLSHYRNVLRAFYGFYLPFERSLFECLDPELLRFFTGRRKTPLLVADLRFFAVTPDLMPLCTGLPVTESEPAVLGASYVLEGSTLGGQLIARELERRLGLRDGNGYRFFSGYGRETGMMWRSFTALVSDRLCLPDAQETAIAGARNTFQSLYAWFEERSVVNRVQRLHPSPAALGESALQGMSAHD